LDRAIAAYSSRVFSPLPALTGQDFP